MRPRRETKQSIVMTSKVRSVWCSYLALLLGPLQDPLLNGTLHNQSVDRHLFSLSQTMGSVHCLRTQKTILTQQYTARIKCTPPNEAIIPNNHLLVNCWVPITVIEYHLYKQNKLLSTTMVPDNKRLLHLLEFRPLTVSAAVRLIPRPPALVLSRNTKMSDLAKIEEMGCENQPL